MAGVHGDFAKLAAFCRRLEKVGAGEAVERMKAAMAQELHTHVMRCFSTSTAPDGTPWLPIQRRKRGDVEKAKPLLDTGRLRNSIHTTPVAQGVRVATNVVYARIHNEGGVIRQGARERSGSVRVSTGKAARTGRITFSDKSHYGSGNRVIVIPCRRFIPDPGRPMPPLWTAALLEQAQRAFLTSVPREGRP